MTWQDLWTYILANKATVIFDSGLVLSALVKTLPIPGQPFHLYYWLYDASHAFFNITNTRLNSQPIVTPPTSSPESLPEKTV